MFESLKEVPKQYGYEPNSHAIALFIVVVYTLLAWVRKIEKFSFVFFLGNFLILIGCTVVVVFCIERLEQFGVAEGPVPINYLEYWNMIGFSIYTFEGIGVVMPILQACNCPEKFPTLLFWAVALLAVAITGFSEIAYFAYGNELTKPIILSIMPKDSLLVNVVKILFCINLACSYPLCIYPVNVIVEGYLFKNMSHSHLRKWLKNLSRMTFVILGAVMALIFAEHLDKFLSLLGAVLCAPLAITFPTLFHLKLIAKTKYEKVEDIIIIGISFFIFVFCTMHTLL